MLRAAIAFVIIGLLAFAIGAGNIAGLSMGVGKLLLEIFVILAVISFVASLFTGKKNRIN